MKLNKRFLVILTIVMILALALTGCSNSSKPAASSPGAGSEPAKPSAPVFLSFAGGPSTGVFGKGAAAISVVLKDKTSGKYNATAQATSGGQENITLVGTGQSHMGIVAAPDLHEAYYGVGLWEGKKQDNFYIIGSTFEAVMQVTTMEKSSIKKFEDLAGKTLSLGSPTSSSTGFMERLLQTTGVNVTKKYLPGGDAATAMKDGQLDAYNWGPTIPAPDTNNLIATSKIRLLDLGTPAEASGFLKKYPYYYPYTIKAGTYTGIDYDVPTVATGTFWIVNKDMDEQTVYELTKAAYDNTADLANAWGPLKLMKPDASVLKGIDVPLHPGAVKYWKEKGVEIPTAVMPK
jgi:TRAP transporter TAXI family solute receptor